MNRRSVVIVDDLAELRQILRLVLEHGGPFRVVGEGRNGHEAVELAAEHHPDLLVMDVEMPGGPSGWEVLPQLREVAPETLVVILSGSRVDRHRVEDSSLAAAVLEKGLPPKELNAALLEVLRVEDSTVAAGRAPGTPPTTDAVPPPAAPTARQQAPSPAEFPGGLEAFAAAASHDLAQPLQVAYGYLEMLRSDYGAGLDPTAASWLDAAVTSLDHLRVHVQGLLSFARTGARAPRADALDLGDLLDEAIAQLPGDLAGRTWTLHRGELPVVRADGPHLVTVFRELIDNAVRFAVDGTATRLDVSAEDRRHEWVVTVADFGPGVIPSLGDRAFEAFSRSPATSGGGPGLGLAICRRLVEAQGGRIWLEPTPPGAGATFRFSLPRSERSDTSGG